MQTNDSGQLPHVLPVLEMLTEEQLVQLNHIVVARLRLMQQIRAHGTMTQFRIGQRVRFTNSAGQMIRGVFSRFNRKTVTIITDGGHEWRVSPSLLVAE
jgi:hypothetical protein